MGPYSQERADHGTHEQPSKGTPYPTIYGIPSIYSATLQPPQSFSKFLILGRYENEYPQKI